MCIASSEKYLWGKLPKVVLGRSRILFYLGLDEVVALNGPAKPKRLHFIFSSFHHYRHKVDRVG